MAEEKIPEVTIENPDLTQVIEDAKKGRVSIEEYNEVVKQNKQLLAAIYDGKKLPSEPAEEKKDISKLCDGLNGDNTNLNYVKKALELRKQVIMQKGPDADPFVSFNPAQAPSVADYEKAQSIAEGLQAMVDEAEDDPGAFQVLIQQCFRDAKKI